MKGSTIFESLSDDIRERDVQIFDTVCRGDIHVEWTPVGLEYNDYKILVMVSSDVLALGDTEDHIRVNVTAQLAEDITRKLGFAPMTARLSDRIYNAATMIIAPQTQEPSSAKRAASGYSPHMHDVAANIRSDSDITARVRAASGQGGCSSLVDGCFKWWVATVKKRANRVANYGFYWPTGSPGTLPSIRLIQTLMFGHSRIHTDYSQFFRCVMDEFTVTDPAGATTVLTFDEIAAHPALWPVVSSEGPMSSWSIAQPQTDPQNNPETISRTLRRGMVGEDVRAWQTTIGTTADGVFGPVTHAATVDFQHAHSIPATGRVDPVTLAEANDSSGVDASAWDDSVDIDNLKFVEAKNYNRVDRTDIRYIVIHDMEAPELSTTAESVAAYFQGKYGTAPMASAHLNIDNDSVVQGVPFDKVAYHAKSGNRYGVGIEHAGFARQTAAEWLDEYGESMLWLSAQCTAQLCLRYNIPVREMSRAQVNRHEKGITTHAMVTRAHKVRGGHVDPGEGFPMSYYLMLVYRAIRLR